MKYLILIAALHIPAVLSGRTYSSFDPPTRSEVVPTIRRSLQRSLPADAWNAPVSKYLSTDTVTTLQDIFKQKHLTISLEDLQRISERGLGEASILDFLEGLLKAIMLALEFDIRELFVSLVDPLIEITIALKPLPEYQLTEHIMDGDKPMRYIEETFDNWGSTLLANVTVRTFFPRTVVGIQNIVRNASTVGARVRASATRHTFNPWLWGVESSVQPGTEGHNTDYIISMVPLSVSDKLANKRDHGTWPEDTELVSIEGPLHTWLGQDGRSHAAVRFGAGTLNLHYYNWALANNWTMPANTIMHYMSIGGVAMGTCHGGGIGHQTIADRIIEMDYVDSTGSLQTISDPELLKVAAGSMGLLGVVTSITYELDEMSYARYHPKISESSLTTVLPPPGTDIPTDMVERLQHYYSEFIQYLGYNGDPGVLWLYTFQNDGKAEEATVIIDELENAFQEDLLFLNQVGESLFQTILEHYETDEYLYWIFGWITGKAAAFAMPDFDTSITTTVTEAMHFRRGLHYLIVRAAELIVPIPLLENGEYDFRIVQEVVYDMKKVHDDFVSRGLHPVDYAFEARMMSGSELYMSSQYGNSASLAIEVAASPLIPEHVWVQFKNALASNWRNYKDQAGNPLRVRPHWAKEFPLEVGGQDIYDYMREVYQDQIPLFVEGLHQIMARTNGNLTHTINMFSTKYLDKIFEGFF